MRLVPRPVHFAGLLVALLSLGGSLASAAEFTATARVITDTALRQEQAGSLDPVIHLRQATTGARSVLTDTVAGTRQTVSGAAWASATYGHLALSAFSEVLQQSASLQPGATAQARAEANLGDAFVITCASCAEGTRGAMHFKVVLAGDINFTHAATDAAGQPAADAPGRWMEDYWSTNLSMHAEGVAGEFPGPGTLALNAYESRTMLNDTVVQGSGREGLGEYDYFLEFEFGRPISMSWNVVLQTSAWLNPGEPDFAGSLRTTSFADFSHSFSWGGISEVFDAAGNRVSAFTALNGEGVDYARALAVVPEPGSWALMVGGLTLLGGLARRARGAAPRSSRARTPAPLLAALLALGSGAAAAAEFTATAGASAQGATKQQQQGGPDPKTGDAPVWSGADVNLYDGAPGVLQYAGSNGYASASYGHLVFVSRAATTQTSVSGDQPGVHAESYASASAVDSFTIACPSCVAGTRGTMNFRVVLAGDVGLNNSSTNMAGQPIPGAARTTQYSWSSNLSMRAEGVAMEFPGPGTLSLYAYDFRAMINDDIVAGGSREGMGIYDYQLEFEFGSPIHMNWLGSASSSADLRAGDGNAIGALSAMGYAAFSNSFYWDGISTVTDAGGNLVSGFTALNSVGIDYARSMADAAVVPEPGTWALMAAGMGLLGMLARRRPRPPRSRTTIAPVVAVLGGALMLGDAALAQQPTPPAFSVGYLYEMGAPGTSGRSAQGGGESALGEVRGFTDAVGARDASLNFDARIEGWGAARYGHLQAFAKGSTTLSTRGEHGVYVSGGITTSLTDSFVIQCGTCAAGTTGWMTFNVRFDAATTRDSALGQPGDGTPLLMADTHWTTSLNLSAAGVPDPPPMPPDGWGGPNPGQLWQTTYRLDKLHNGEHSVEEMTRGSSPSGELSIEFVFGEPIRLDMSLSASVLGVVSSGANSASFSGHSAMETDATRSMYWDGIGTVFDAQGNRVTGFTALNAAGVDYARSFANAAPVPEPGTWALMATGLGLLGVLARRQQRARRKGTRPAPRSTRRCAALLAGSAGLLGTGLGGAALAQSPPAFEVGYSYDLIAPGDTSRRDYGSVFTSTGQVRRFSDAIAFSDATRSAQAQVEGWGAAQYGHLQAYAKGSTALAAQGPGNRTVAEGGVTVSLIDSFVIQCGGCAPGSTGSMNFRVFLDAATARDGGLGQPVSPTGGYVADTQWWSGFAITASGVPDASPQPGSPNPGLQRFQYYRLDTLHNDVARVDESAGGPAGLRELSIQFVFGEPIRLDMSLSALVIGGVHTEENATPFSGHAAMETDATRSMYWDGITRVLDAQGEVVNGFTALNVAGIDYARSFAAAAVVPEPGAWALMASGLALLAWRLRRGARRLGRAMTMAAFAAGGIASAPAMAQAPEFRTSQSLTTSLAGQSLSQTRDGGLRDVRVDGALTQMSQSADLSGSVQLSTWGRAGYGYVQAFAQGASLLSTTRTNQAAEAFGSSSASSSDSFVINCDGCVAGTRGRFRARVYLDGTTQLAGGVDNPAALHAGYVDRAAGVSVQADGVPWDSPPPDWPPGEPFPPNNPGLVGTGGQRMDILYNEYTETFGDASFEPGYRDLVVHFIFGQPIHVQLYSSASVMAVVAERDEPAVSGWAMSTTDLSRSTFWDGVLGVVDENENPLREFTALNAAGIDYRRSFANAAAAAVPEPGTWALLLSGLALLGLGARGRRVAVRRLTRAVSAASAAGAAGLLGLTAPAQAQTFSVDYNYAISAFGVGARHGADGGVTLPGEKRQFSDAVRYDAPLQKAASSMDGWGAAYDGHLQAYIKGTTSLVASGPNHETWLFGDVKSSLTDSFIIQCGTCTAGTTGRMNFRVFFDAVPTGQGSMTQSPPNAEAFYIASNLWTSDLAVRAEGLSSPADGQVDLHHYRYDRLLNGVRETEQSPGSSAGMQTLSIDFVFGQPIHLDMSLEASLSGNLYSGRNTDSFVGQASMETDATRSMYWAGISSVLDAQGNAVTGYTALNQRGLDYVRSFASATAVPEPGTWALMAVGLAWLALARRRRG